MKSICNKCGKEVECNNEIRRTDKVIVFDDNTCCPGFKAFHKIEPEPVIEPDIKNDIHFECKYCGKKMNVSSLNQVIYKNGVSVCCGYGPESYYITYDNDITYNHGSSFKEDVQYHNDLCGTYSEAWNNKDHQDTFSGYEDDE